MCTIQNELNDVKYSPLDVQSQIGQPQLMHILGQTAMQSPGVKP